MKVALVCGEPSGDLLGAGLAGALRKASPDVELVGVTGPAMRAAGVASWRDCGVFSVMGYWAVLQRLGHIYQARRQLLARLAAERADVYVGIDAPDLNMEVGRQARALGSKYIQYVCPSFWIWRARRARFLAAHCDKVLAVLPFEQDRCAAAGIACEYVGHRLADELAAPPADRSAAKSELGVDPQAPLLGLLPGSRAQELRHHEQLFAAAAQRCAKLVPGLQVRSAPLDMTARPGEQHPARQLLRAADVALVKSGTVTLEAALLDCPQVIAYRTGSIAARFIGYRLGGIHNHVYGLPNLVAAKPFVPELIQDRATPEALAAQLARLLAGEQDRAAMRAGYAQVRTTLARGADARAAAAVLAAARG